MPHPLVAALIDLAVPAVCVACGQAGADLCAACAAPLQAPPRWVAPAPCPPGLPPVAAVTAYDEGVRMAVVTYKERAAFALADVLSAALARATALALTVAGAAPVLVPMPSTAAARQVRADDPLGRLAHRAAASLRRAGFAVSVLDGALHHVRAVRDSAGLSAPDRAANLAGALTLTPPAARRLAGRRPVLVDDLMTTGATLAEASRALRVVGAEPAAAAVVAAAVRRHPGRATTGAGGPSGLA